MRDKSLLRQRSIDMNIFYNEEFDKLKSDPLNKITPISTLMKQAVCRTGAKFYLSVARTEDILFAKKAAKTG